MPIDYEKTDLRIRKTQAAIRNAFKEMVMEMDASKITIKELSDRAMIHRKTFYLHYTSIEALYESILRELSEEYYKEIDQIPEDAPFTETNRVFFTFMAAQEPYMEKILCTPEYHDFSDRLFLSMLVHNRSRYNPYAAYSREQQNIINTFLGTTSINMYRQWVKDGKKLPLEDLIELSGTLFLKGIEAIL